MSEKIILTDCDGVLLDWNTKFALWVSRSYPELRLINPQVYNIGKRYGITREHGRQLVSEFNNSEEIADLLPYGNSDIYVKRLYNEYGYRFKVITSLSLNPDAVSRRIFNLRKVFGDAIDSVVCLDTGADKDEALEPYRGSKMYFIEDKLANARVAKNIGLTPIFVQHNEDVLTDNLITVRTWEEIYNLVSS